MNNYFTQRYQAAAARVKKIDSGVFIGMCSSQEIERLEKYADELEARAKAAVRDDPRNVAVQILAELHQRGLAARGQVIEWQYELRRHKKELTLLDMPTEYLDEPPLVPGSMPSLPSSDYDAYNEDFAKTVTKLEMMATKFKNYVQGWARLSLEEQNRELIMALAKRIAN